MLGTSLSASPSVSCPSDAASRRRSSDQCRLVLAMNGCRRVIQIGRACRTSGRFCSTACRSFLFVRPRLRRVRQTDTRWTVIWCASPVSSTKSNLRCKMGQGCRQAGQGQGRASDLLRLPCRTLEAHPDVKSDRKHLHRRLASHKTYQGVPQPQDWTGYGLQADDVRLKEMAKTRRP